MNSSLDLVQFFNVNIGPLFPEIGCASNIFHVLDSLQKRPNLIQFSILRIVDEGGTINGILGVEDVRARRVINDNGLSQVAIDETKILNVVAFVIHTRLAEETSTNHTVGIQEVQQRISILIEASSVDDNFVVFGHFRQEFVNTGSLCDIDKVNDIFNL